MSATVSRVESRITSVAGLCTVGGMAVAAVMWFAKLESGVAELREHYALAAVRLDRIDESRTVGLQRLAKTEEAISRVDEVLSRMDAKLDRAIERR